MNRLKQEQNEISHFTEISHVWWGLKSEAGQERYDNKFDKFKEICKIKDGSKILEVGCGNGVFTKRLIKIKNKNIKIFAIDITPILISDAKNNIKKNNLVFKVDSLHKLNFPDNSFDIVCGISILHHVDLSKALSEIHRVLKPGGEMFFTEPNIINPVIFLGLNIPALRKKMEFSDDESAFNRWGLAKTISKYKFRDIKVSNYDFLHPSTPKKLIPTIEKIGKIAEKVPLIKEVSGSLIVYAKK